MEETAIEKGDQVYKLFQMKIEEASQGYSRVTMPVTDITTNGMGFVHGGVLYSLADIAFGAASNFGEKTGTVTLSSHISYLSPGRKGPIVAEAKALRTGRHVVLYNIDIHDADGRHLAHATFEGFRTDFAFTNVKA
ncbi:MAG: PaaI family thioesterase [Desulfovibrionaceae bacterium]|nr:PaaI family thioesterase [Desulfovibrionaceae bacterium]